MNILQPTENFDFSKLTLSHPTSIHGGSFFTKLEYNLKPLYIQTTKSKTRQGFVKSGKKYYCDLMFDKNSEILINWFENLEEHCQKLIFVKRDDWFENSLEQADIENAFSPVIKVYKSGKFYLIRTNIKNTHNNDIPFITIYDEQENNLKMEDITEDSSVICILEINGIKFTNKNFQIEISLKQVMAFDKEPVFNNCLIKKEKIKKENVENVKEDNYNLINDKINDTVNDTFENNFNNDNLEKKVCFENIQNDNLEEKKNKQFKIKDKTNDNENELKLDIEEINLNEIDNFESLESSLNNLEKFEMKLKKPNEVYIELYKTAREKAKEAKKNAILAYLDAKKIKEMYVLPKILNDGNDEFDMEINEVSESELEEFK